MRLDQPSAVLRGDRFVLRSYSPVQTIGGGIVLNPLPRKHKGSAKREAAKALEVLFNSSDSEIILWHLEDAGWNGLSEQELRIRTNVPQKFLEKTLQQFTSSKKAVLYDKENRRLIHPEALDEIKESIVAILVRLSSAVSVEGRDEQGRNSRPACESQSMGKYIILFCASLSNPNKSHRKWNGSGSLLIKLR